jgi:integrase
MAYAEKRAGSWRARWRDPDGVLQSEPGFKTRKAAEDYGKDQEAAIRNNTYIDPKAGRITLTEWVNLWYPALDLEPTTLSNYRYLIEVHILPEFGGRALASLSREEIAAWEIRIVKRGYTRRTAQDVRSMLTTILGDAIPRYIQSNPAERRRGKGRKGHRRVARHQSARKVWATPLQALLVAERCAALSGRSTDFVMVITIAYTGMRWSEAIGLPVDCVHDDQLDIDWKLYELNGRFYKGAPKDGSMRPADLPPFLAELIAAELASAANLRCTCRSSQPTARMLSDSAVPISWCQGEKYVFLGPDGGHFRRSNYSERFFRPAADGWYLARGGKNPRPATPVLVTDCEMFPGRPVPPWPAAVPGEEFAPLTGRGVARLVNDARTARCSTCGRAWPRRQDGNLISHQAHGKRCAGSGQGPAEDATLASWLPVLRGLTPHGLRHGLQTWMDEDGIPEVLKTERMGHELPGMHGVYGHVSPAMRANLKAALQERWEASLRERAQLNPRSIVPILDALLATAKPSRPLRGRS